MRLLRPRNGCNLTTPFTVSVRMLCLVSSFSSQSSDGSFHKAMAQ